jgi:hypothetical protein
MSAVRSSAGQPPTFWPTFVRRVLLGCAIGCGGCSTASTQLVDDPYGPLTAEQEASYLREMEAADAYVRDPDR